MHPKSEAVSGIPHLQQREDFSCLNKDHFSPYRMKVINSMTLSMGTPEHTRQFRKHTHSPLNYF